MGESQIQLRDYAVVTAGYWGFTLTDGALRMLVLLYFHDLGYSAVAVAVLFLLYEFMGIVTNLVGGWAGARSGLNRTLVTGLGIQIVVLAALSLHSREWSELASVAYVMGFQALSGVAKDLTKMSSKSAVKFVAGDRVLFRLVAGLTGSKNALKGVGFFLGAALLGSVGYSSALRIMAVALAVAGGAVAMGLGADLGKSPEPRRLSAVLGGSAAVNRLSAARVALFCSRDMWFVVALPIFLDEQLGWEYEAIGAFLAAWVIGYGVVQSAAPWVLRSSRGDIEVEARAAGTWVFALLAVTVVIAVCATADIAVTATVLAGLVVFGAVFAVNSSLHSYLILAFSNSEDVAMTVGFYYSANALGRLVGTMASGVLYLAGGLVAALCGSVISLAIAWLVTRTLPATVGASSSPAAIV